MITRYAAHETSYLKKRILEITVNTKKVISIGFEKSAFDSRSMFNSKIWFLLALSIVY